MWPGIWGKEVLHVGSVFTTFLDCSFLVLRCDFSDIHLCNPNSEITRTACGRGGALWVGGFVFYSFTLQLCTSVPSTKILAESDKEPSYCLGEFDCFCGACFVKLVDCVQLQIGNCWHCSHLEFLLVGYCFGSVSLYRLWWLSSYMDRFLRRSIFRPLGVP